MTLGEIHNQTEISQMKTGILAYWVDQNKGLSQVSMFSCTWVANVWFKSLRITAYTKAYVLK